MANGCFALAVVVVVQAAAKSMNFVFLALRHALVSMRRVFAEDLLGVADILVHIVVRVAELRMAVQLHFAERLFQVVTAITAFVAAEPAVATPRIFTVIIVIVATTTIAVVRMTTGAALGLQEVTGLGLGVRAVAELDLLAGPFGRMILPVTAWLGAFGDARIVVGYAGGSVTREVQVETARAGRLDDVSTAGLGDDT